MKAAKMDHPEEPTSHDERSQLLRFSRFSEYGEVPQASLPNKKPGKSRSRWVIDYLKSDIDMQWVEIPLIVCFFLSGLVDAGAYNAYSCFVTMMTGNTIFAALGVSDLPVSTSRYAWTKSITALSSFATGTLVLSALYRRMGVLKRGVLFVSFLLQTVVIGVAAVLVAHHGSTSKGRHPPDTAAETKLRLRSLPEDPGFPWLDLVPIALLSFQAADKVLASRHLRHGHLTTVVLTMLYSDLLSDPGLFTAGLLENGRRNQRVSGFVLYFAGAVLGGVMASSEIGFAGALWIATAVNLCLATAWLFWRVEDRLGEDST